VRNHLTDLPFFGWTLRLGRKTQPKMEHAMKRITALAVAAAFFSLPAAAQTPPGKSGTAPGQTGLTPGHLQQGTQGSAKEFAPGQKQQEPGGAKNLAPGAGQRKK